MSARTSRSARPRCRRAAQALGLGDQDEETNTLEGDSTGSGGRARPAPWWTLVDHPGPTNTSTTAVPAHGHPGLTDNFTTKQDSVTVCEVIITGVFKRPALPSLKPYAVMQLADDRSNEAACTAFLTAEESKPGA